jgi:drug/metabolite transporter (DMT)-like permease
MHAGSLGIVIAVIIATLAGHSQPPSAAQIIVVWPELAYTVFCVSVFGILFWNMGVAKLGPISPGSSPTSRRHHLPDRHRPGPPPRCH